ncbi:hypothetical protein FWG76_01805 [Candidatus Saccharibacteria bacterium]|nr:hypothetical protein [Candidatus Saccharibacteria bacterium]
MIKFYPEGRPVIFTSGDVAIRSARINGFPYAVYFAYSKKEDVVYLYGIMHSRRDPKTVRRVMKGREP